jgi:hypothetical protein
MNAYELYRCIREDGTSKDWAVRINPDGTITTRWGRTGKKLINIQTRKVDLTALKRSKSKKGYFWVGTYEIDVLGRINCEGHCDTGHIVQTSIPSIHWQLALGGHVSERDLIGWHEGVISTLHDRGLDLDSDSLPESQVSGIGVISCSDVALLLGLLLMKQRTPHGVRFTLRTPDNREIEPDLHRVTHLLEALGIDLPSIRPLAESLGILAPRLDLRLAILSERHCWF